MYAVGGEGLYLCFWPRYFFKIPKKKQDLECCRKFACFLFYLRSFKKVYALEKENKGFLQITFYKVVHLINIRKF